MKNITTCHLNQISTSYTSDRSIDHWRRERDYIFSSIADSKYASDTLLPRSFNEDEYPFRGGRATCKDIFIEVNRNNNYIDVSINSPFETILTSKIGNYPKAS